MNTIRIAAVVIEFGTFILATWWFYKSVRQKNEAEYWASLALLMYNATFVGRTIQDPNRPTTWATVMIALGSLAAIRAFLLRRKNEKRRKENHGD